MFVSSLNTFIRREEVEQGKLHFRLESEKLHLHSTCELYLVPRESIFPNPECWSSPPSPSGCMAGHKLSAGSILSDLVHPLKPHPGASYWSGSCPIDLILSSLSLSERRMGFAYCFSLLHDWVSATDDTWHCPLLA